MSENQSGKAIMAVLKETPAAEVANLPFVEEKFIKLMQHIQRVPKNVAESVFHAEKFHFLKRINENADLRACEPLSLYGVFIDVAVNGLSLDPTKNLVYVIPNNVNVGTKESPIWAKRAALSISPQGELAIRQRDGQIKYADNVVIVYEGDEFQPGTDAAGNKTVHYKLNVSHSTVIIGAYIRIVRVDGSVDFQWMLKADIDRLAGYSERKNKGKVNALYTSNNGQIDSGFLAAKMIKHAFKAYPKARIGGSFAQLETDKIELTEEEIYGLDTKELPDPSVKNLGQPTMMVTSPEPSYEAKAAKLQMQSSGQPELNGSVTVQDADEY